MHSKLLSNTLPTDSRALLSQALWLGLSNRLIPEMLTVLFLRSGLLLFWQMKKLRFSKAKDLPRVP
jgi:hypothetical protein